MIRRRPALRAWTALLLAAVVAGVIAALGPFAVALELHHILAKADQDGHEHSASDLCRWVQDHTAQSVLAAAPLIAHVAALGVLEPSVPHRPPLSRPASASPPRGPPFV